MPPISLTTPEVVSRNWGSEITLVRTDTHCGKLLLRKAGTKGGYQFHVKEESHFLLLGALKLRTASGEHIVEAGSAWTVPPFTVHQEEAITECVIIEVSDPTTDDRVSMELDPGGLPSMDDEQAAAKMIDLAQRLEGRANGYRMLASAARRKGLKEVATWTCS